MDQCVEPNLVAFDDVVDPNDLRLYDFGDSHSGQASSVNLGSPTKSDPQSLEEDFDHNGIDHNEIVDKRSTSGSESDQSFSSKNHLIRMIPLYECVVATHHSPERIR
jgi:hypothetical protein